jgi:hypothetical protein
VTGLAATATRAQEQLFLQGLTSNIGSMLGFTGKTIGSFFTREAIDNAAYGIGEQILEPSDKPLEDIALSALGGAVTGSAIRGVGLGLGHLIGTRGNLLRRLEHEFGGEIQSRDVLQRLANTNIGNIIDNLSDAELDALGRVASGRGKHASDLRTDLESYRTMRRDVIQATENERLRGLTELGSEATARDISERRISDMLAESHTSAQERLANLSDAENLRMRNRISEEQGLINAESTQQRLTEQRVSDMLGESRIRSAEQIAQGGQAEQLRTGRMISEEQARLNTERTLGDITNARVESTLRETAIRSQEQIALAKLSQDTRRLVEHADVRIKAGLPADLSDTALRASDQNDFRIRVESNLRMLEKDVLSGKVNQQDEFNRRLSIATDLGAASGKVSGNPLNRMFEQSKGNGIISNVDNLLMTEAKQVAQALKTSGIDNVSIVLNKVEGGYSVLSTLGESQNEMSAMQMLTRRISNSGIVDTAKGTYSGLTSDQHVDLQRALGSSESEVGKLKRFIDQTLKQANDAGVNMPVTVRQLGVDSIESQAISSSRSASMIRTDVGQILPPPKPFLVSEPIVFNGPRGETTGTVRAIAIDQSGRQAIIAALPDGSEIHVTDDMAPKHIFNETMAGQITQQVPDVSVTDSHLRVMQDLDPQTRIPDIKIQPGELQKGLDILKQSGLTIKLTRRANGVHLDIPGVTKLTVNEREAEAIVENLVKSRLVQLQMVNKLGGKDCL